MDRKALSEEFRRKVFKMSVDALPGLEKSDPVMMSIFIDELAFVIGLAVSNAPEEHHEYLVEAIKESVEEGIEVIKTRKLNKNLGDMPLPSGTLH